MMVLWGLISPQLLQKVMSLYKADLKLLAEGKLDVKGIDKLAGIGSNGSYPNHIWRDFKKLLPVPKLPKLQMVQFPMKHTTLGKIVHSVPMLLPHTLFAAIYEHYPLMWEKIIYGSRLTCVKFWQAVRGSPQFASHPVRHRDGFEDHCIPLKIHGDGTPVTGLGKGWGKLVDIFSVSSLLICGPTILRNLMMFLISNILFAGMGGTTLWTLLTRCSSGLLKLVGRARSQNLIGMVRRCFTRVLVRICVVASSLLSGH